ncbi:MAG: DNA-directed RNA polymerase subunit omega [Bacteroidetes bacterium]|nr:DNA-directed RNA polymerase subunit omega [Bacteroidota bacterium]
MKEEAKPISPFIESKDLNIITEVSGNLYKSINIVARRSSQLKSRQKEELHKKLEEFASTTDNLEEVIENREQIEISRYYEKLPKTTLEATEEFLNDELYFRLQGEDEA